MAMKKISVTDIADFRLGNAENSEKGTGCTVIICEEGAVGGVDVRGGGPATRETDLLRSENTVNAVNAVVLSGGSAFGLEAASGVMRELAEMKIGFNVGDDIVVPIVCGASLYDLPVGDKVFPDINMGAQAVRNAFAGSFANGNHGAGTGATVGKLKGYGRAMKSGLGTFACGDGVVEVGAIAAVNAVGDIYNGAGNIIAGLRSEDGGSIYGTIKTLKGMVHDNISQAEEIKKPLITKADIEEALAAAARQYREEEAQAEKETPSAPETEPSSLPETAAEEPAEEPAAEFIYEAPAENNFEDQIAVSEEQQESTEELTEAEEVSEEPVQEPEETEEVSEEPVQELEETEEEFQEETAEEYIPETPAVIIPEEPAIEYAEISIPVESAEPEFAEEGVEEPATADIEEPAEEPETEAEITETEAGISEDGFEEPAEVPEEPTVRLEEPVDSSYEIHEEYENESSLETPEEPDEEETYEPVTPETVEFTKEVAEESPSEQIMEETEEDLIEEPSDEPAEEAVEQEEAAVPEELPEVIAVPEDIPEVIAEEEPVALTREEMGYDIVFNTTISCLITNAELTKSQANKLASILHDAYARAIKPVHGTLDGDTVFVLATGKQKVNFDAFAALATDVMQYAIIDGALSAEGAYGLPAARDMQ